MSQRRITLKVGLLREWQGTVVISWWFRIYLLKAGENEQFRLHTVSRDIALHGNRVFQTRSLVVVATLTTHLPSTVTFSFLESSIILWDLSTLVWELRPCPRWGKPILLFLIETLGPGCNNRLSFLYNPQPSHHSSGLVTQFALMVTTFHAKIFWKKMGNNYFYIFILSASLVQSGLTLANLSVD